MTPQYKTPLNDPLVVTLARESIEASTIFMQNMIMSVPGQIRGPHPNGKNIVAADGIGLDSTIGPATGIKPIGILPVARRSLHSRGANVNRSIRRDFTVPSPFTTLLLTIRARVDFGSREISRL
jgi:hypothetical protein